MNTATVVGTSILGLVLLVLGGILYWKKKAPKFVTWAWFFGATAVTGGIVDSAHQLLRQASDAAAPSFGVATNVFLGIVGAGLLLVVWIEAPLKKGKGRTAAATGSGPTPGGRAPAGYTPWLAIASALCLGALTAGKLSSWQGSLVEVLAKIGGPIGTFFGA